SKYGKINDEEKGPIPPIVFPHLRKMCRLLEENRLLMILKARQIYMTWFMAHYALWVALFRSGAKVLMLSRGENEAAETLAYCAFIHRNLPDYLRLKKGKDQSSLITFPTMSSQIRALASTEKSGIGFGGASLVILDEWDFHPYAKENYPEIKPMIDAGGRRQLVILSAVNKLDSETKFKEIWHKASQGENNFKAHFISYDVIPYRDKSWYNQQKMDYDPLDMATRYPKTVEEALSAAADMARFNQESLKEMRRDDVRKPIEVRENGLVKIFKPSVAGRKYCFAIDSSEGEYDPSWGKIIDWRTCESVAEFHGKITVDEQARLAFALWEEYGKPYMSVERNGDGRRLIDKLVAMGITDRYWYKTTKDKLGYYTSSQNRYQFWQRGQDHTIEVWLYYPGNCFSY
ncbi:hypothetical protein LCGC14_2828780, partial [marine sediment metagenome]